MNGNFTGVRRDTVILFADESADIYLRAALAGHLQPVRGNPDVAEFVFTVVFAAGQCGFFGQNCERMGCRFLLKSQDSGLVNHKVAPPPQPPLLHHLFSSKWDHHLPNELHAVLKI